MKVLFLFFAPFCLVAQVQLIRPIPNEVTLFYNGAQVHATFTTAIPKGASTWKIQGLSPSVQKNTVLLTGLGNKVSIRSIEFEQVLYSETEVFSARIHAIELGLKANQKQLALVTNKKSGIEEELNLLNVNKNLSSAQQAVTLEKIQAHAKYYKERVPLLKMELYDLDERFQQLQSKQDSLQDVREKLGESQMYKGQLMIEVENIGSEQSANIGITYQVGGVQWQPVYEIRATKKLDELTCIRKAKIQQQCGEDWKNVKIILSTGNPSLSLETPKIWPNYLRFMNQSRPNASFIQSLQGQVAGLNISAGKSSAGRISDEVSYTPTITSSMTTLLFELPQKGQLLSDNKPKEMEIETFAMPAKFNYFAAPILSNKVYLIAHVAQWDQWHLLAGEAQIYLEGNYAGKTVIDPDLTDADMKISMGTDAAINIERKAIQQFSDKSLFGSVRKTRRQFELIVKNTKEYAIDIELKDRIPVSQDQEITVDEVEVDSASLEEKTGVLVWNIKLPAREVFKKKLSYRVSYPSNKNLLVE
ncbi:MAG: hypothetical protein CFE24_05855 [Flavobacterium sp. BFFFF2]|nr:MAG: hypothetical protein CFE24_05855 [Flavobacterium sp. BFFFF2]